MSATAEHPYAHKAHFLSAGSAALAYDLDARDREFIAGHTVPYWAARTPRPQVGDWVIQEGVYSGPHRRIAILLPDGRFQPGPSHVSYHLGPASVSFSGCPDPSMPLSCLRPTVEAWNAEFWIFHHDHPQASNSLAFHIPRRVWAYAAGRTHLFQSRAMRVI